MLSVTQVFKNLIKGNLETVFLISLLQKLIYKIQNNTDKQTQMIFQHLKKNMGKKGQVHVRNKC